MRGAKAPGSTTNYWWLGSRHRQQTLYIRGVTSMAIPDPRLKSSAWPPISVKDFAEILPRKSFEALHFRMGSSTLER